MWVWMSMMGEAMVVSGWLVGGGSPDSRLERCLFVVLMFSAAD